MISQSLIHHLLLEDDERMEEIWNSQFSLKELVSLDKFKSYDELKEKLDRVLGLGEMSKPKQQEVPFDGGEPIYTTTKTPEQDEDDESLDYFQKALDLKTSSSS